MFWIEEFLYRGREEGSKQPPAWHVVLASRLADGLGGTHVVTKMFNIADAEKAGYSLPKLIASINADTLKSHDATVGERDDLQKQFDNASAAIAQKDEQLAALDAALVKSGENQEALEKALADTVAKAASDLQAREAAVASLSGQLNDALAKLAAQDRTV